MRHETLHRSKLTAGDRERLIHQYVREVFGKDEPAMILRDVMMPLPMRPDWGQEMEWAYPGVPGTVVAEFAGGKDAWLPFFAPETVTTDHGSVYKNHHLIEVQRVIGATIRPSRVLRPADKQAVERAFRAIQSLAGFPPVSHAGTTRLRFVPVSAAISSSAARRRVVAGWSYSAGSGLSGRV